MEDAGKEVIKRVITMIESNDMTCQCNIIRRCETCSEHKERMELVSDLEALLEDDVGGLK